MADGDFKFPWDVRKHWVQTVAIPLLSVIVGLSFLFSCVLLALRSVPGLRLDWWILPFASAMLVVSTGLGTLQYSLSLPYSIRMAEVIAAITVATLSSQGRAVNALLNVCAIACAWTLSMHFSFLLQRIRPVFTVELGEGALRDLVDIANQGAEKNREANMEIFSRDYPAFIMKLGKTLAFCVLMSSLVRPAAPETLGMKTASGVCAAIFLSAALLSLSAANSLTAAHGFAGRRHRIGESFHRRWLTGAAILSLPLCFLAFIMPSAVSPASSPNLSAVSAHFNGIMSDFTDWIGGKMISPQQSGSLYESSLLSRSGSTGIDIFSLILGAILACLNGVDAMRRMSAVGMALSLTAWSLVAVTSLVSAWIVSRAVFAFLKHFRRDMGLPAFPSKLIVSILLWPLGLYRLLKWLAATLFRKLAGFMAGSLAGENAVKRISLKELAKLFRAYGNSAHALPKDPIALIRHIFGRVVALSRRWGTAPGKGGTARDYSETLSAKFPQLKNAVESIRLTYENVRYGAKEADETKAGQVKASYFSLMKAYAKRRDR